jgi:hypothetical protein
VVFVAECGHAFLVRQYSRCEHILLVTEAKASEAKRALCALIFLDTHSIQRWSLFFICFGMYMIVGVCGVDTSRSVVMEYKVGGWGVVDRWKGGMEYGQVNLSYGTLSYPDREVRTFDYGESLCTCPSMAQCLFSVAIMPQSFLSPSQPSPHVPHLLPNLPPFALNPLLSLLNNHNAPKHVHARTHSIL